MLNRAPICLQKEFEQASITPRWLPLKLNISSAIIVNRYTKLIDFARRIYIMPDVSSSVTLALRESRDWYLLNSQI